MDRKAMKEIRKSLKTLLRVVQTYEKSDYTCPAETREALTVEAQYVIRQADSLGRTK